jgi:hypothetical protein
MVVAGMRGQQRGQGEQNQGDQTGKKSPEKAGG